MYLEILDSKRKEVFSKLDFTKGLGMYLAGGTALSLHLGHRTSFDFDFYRDEEFVAGDLRSYFDKNLADVNLKVIRDENNTFEVSMDGIHLSCFYYPYSLIRKLDLLLGIQIASVEDIAAMKMIAIIQRGAYRDFVDIYYLLKRFSLEDLFSYAQKKYKSFDTYSCLRGLIYFADAESSLEEEQKRIKVFDRKVTWNKIKFSITDAVVSYQHQFLREP